MNQGGPVLLGCALTCLTTAGVGIAAVSFWFYRELQDTPLAQVVESLPEDFPEAYRSPTILLVTPGVIGCELRKIDVLHQRSEIWMKLAACPGDATKALFTTDQRRALFLETGGLFSNKLQWLDLERKVAKEIDLPDAKNVQISLAALNAAGEIYVFGRGGGEEKSDPTPGGREFEGQFYPFLSENTWENELIHVWKREGKAWKRVETRMVTGLSYDDETWPTLLAAWRDVRYRTGGDGPHRPLLPLPPEESTRITEAVVKLLPPSFYLEGGNWGQIETPYGIVAAQIPAYDTAIRAPLLRLEPADRQPRVLGALPENSWESGYQIQVLGPWLLTRAKEQGAFMYDLRSGQQVFEGKGMLLAQFWPPIETDYASMTVVPPSADAIPE